MKVGHRAGPKLWDIAGVLAAVMIISCPLASGQFGPTKPRPLNPGQTEFKKGSTVRPGAKPLASDITLDRDVAIKMRDGIVIYADLFRPTGGTNLPTVIAWTPYGKNEGTPGIAFASFGKGGQQIPSDTPPPGVTLSDVSGLQVFEGPDPGYWCAHGYAILNVDPRGSFNSGGKGGMMSAQGSDDGYDAVEWVASQPWSNGKVAFSGNSALAMAQWGIAALRPPHLAAIAPWEGVTDLPRDSMSRGGVAGSVGGRPGGNANSGPPNQPPAQPLMGPELRSMAAHLQDIQVPAYIVASYTSGLHVTGTFRGWEWIPSKDKWLRVHNTHEWPDLYQYEDDLRRFFDHYLKGLDNGWESTPRVRISELNPGGKDIINIPELDFPLPHTQYQAFYLDAASHSLLRAQPDSESQAAYPSGNHDSQAVFTIKFDRPFDIIGHISLHTWLAAKDATDMDVFVYVQKLDADGKLIEPIVDDELWHGQDGRLRVSMRQIDTTRSKPYDPYLTFATVQPLTPGTPVPVDIQIQPLGMHWDAGQQLRLVVRGYPLSPLPFGAKSMDTINKGDHVIYTGGKFDSYLLLPLLPTESPEY
jgi:uncharacterized protein